MYSFPKDTHRLHEYPNVLVTLNKSICQRYLQQVVKLWDLQRYVIGEQLFCLSTQWILSTQTTIMQRSQIDPGCVLFQLNSYLLIQWLAVVFYLDEGNTNIQLQFKHHLCPWTWSRLPCLLSLSTFVDEEVWLRIFFLAEIASSVLCSLLPNKQHKPFKTSLRSHTVNAFTFTALCWEWKYLVYILQRWTYPHCIIRVYLQHLSFGHNECKCSLFSDKEIAVLWAADVQVPRALAFT